MDLTGLFDVFGEPGTSALGGLAIGIAFGIFAQRSRFCLRAAVIEFARGSIGIKVAVWLVAFTSAVLITQAMLQLDLIDVSEARQFAARGSLSGALIGGALFGIGMVLARGCASRLLVLSATGNLRALLSGLIFAVAAEASIHGILSPLREKLAGLWTVGGRDNLDLLQTLGLGAEAGLVIGLLFVCGAVFFAVRAGLGPWGWLGAAGVGATVAAGWWFTYQMSIQAFEPMTVKSMTFTGPSADTLMSVLTLPGTNIDFDIGLVPGVFIGAALAALVAREWTLQGFEGGRSMRRYMAGAVLMGFGGMLAGGCAVGAGVTGGSIFALTAWLTLAAMWAAAGLTDLVVDRLPNARATQMQAPQAF
ncbi:YeeE/YedE family protein [Stappia stellulata]|uniref:YeeE/YedE family protein n=1 Tax=Stappia stellulata TaxID=71235 RepID=UPI001CD27A08|nr:YeeE/YedE family protein [Stappia stellulata]MCA1243123.1 YeeE/YedE family protein [Stappia stellulata]